MMPSPFESNSVVVVYLQQPSVKVWGVLRSLDPAGVAVEGIDLRSFDDWMRGVVAREIGPRDTSIAFYPLGRVEKILLDRGTEAAPSLQEQFMARVGVSLMEFLAT